MNDFIGRIDCHIQILTIFCISVCLECRTASQGQRCIFIRPSFIGCFRKPFYCLIQITHNQLIAFLYTCCQRCFKSLSIIRRQHAVYWDKTPHLTGHIKVQSTTQKVAFSYQLFLLQFGQHCGFRYFFKNLIATTLYTETPESVIRVSIKPCFCSC